MLSPFQLGKPAGPAAIGSPGILGTIDRYIEEIRTAALAGKPLQSVVIPIMHALGFEHFGFGITTAVRPTRDSRSFMWTTMPRQWIEIYDRKAYVEIDPRVTTTLDRNTPFVWDSADFEHREELREFFADAAKYGIRSGVSICVNDPLFARMGFGFSSPISPVDAARRRKIDAVLGDLMLFAAGFHDLFVANYFDPNNLAPMSGTPLSPREQECLVLAARGIVSADIGTKLGIAERTVHFHFANIVSKLGALNRAEAISIAVTNGLIRVDR
jgi:LuxR family transcriptional activator of conjugal transfer of Ti plasmids